MGLWGFVVLPIHRTFGCEMCFLFLSRLGVDCDEAERVGHVSVMFIQMRPTPCEWATEMRAPPPLNGPITEACRFT